MSRPFLFLMMINNITGQPTFISFMKLDTAENAHALIGAITSLFYVGGVFGSFLAGWLSDKYGRKGAQIIASIVLVIGTACLAGSANVAMFIVFRFVVGAGYVLCLLHHSGMRHSC